LFHFWAVGGEEGMAVAEQQDIELEGEEFFQGLFQLGRVVEFMVGDEVARRPGK
jgi:hypothetical protein